MTDASLLISPPVTDEALNQLFAASWPDHLMRPFAPVLERSLAYICAYRDDSLVGFVNVAWDGGVHAFMLDVTVHPSERRRGLGVKLARQAASACRVRGIEWVHVDYEARLRPFYERCGFRPTAAGLIHLRGPAS